MWKSLVAVVLSAAPLGAALAQAASAAMPSTDSSAIANILSVGFAGFGFFLVWFTFRLLAKEMERDPVRWSSMVAIFVFMLFAVALSALSIVAQVAPEYIADRKLNEMCTFIQRSEEFRNNEGARKALGGECARIRLAR